MTRKGTQAGEIAAGREEVRRFGLLFAGLCALVATYLLFRGRAAWPWFAGGGIFFLATGLLGYPVLRPLYIGWMKFALVLGWVNTRILLGLFFYLILSPIAVILKLLGKDLLDEKIDPHASTYWEKRSQGAVDRNRYERLF